MGETNGYPEKEMHDEEITPEEDVDHACPSPVPPVPDRKEQDMASQSCDDPETLRNEEVAPEAPLSVQPSSEPAVSHDMIQRIVSSIEDIQASVSELKQTTASLLQEQKIMQHGMRQIGARIREAATSLSAPRIRSLYDRLLLMYDLLEPPPAHLSPESTSLCKLISAQVEQFLAVNGFAKIAADGATFDPTLHKPEEVIDVQDAGMDSRVLATKRNGFKSENAVLRPAYVTIARFVAPPAQPQEDDVARGSGESRIEDNSNPNPQERSDKNE